ncbi:phosphatidate cytidylyltransferase [Desulfocicer niacini]
MLLKRWLTAVVLLPLLVLILLRGTPFVFTALVFALSLMGLREYFVIVPLPGDASAGGDGPLFVHCATDTPEKHVHAHPSRKSLHLLLNIFNRLLNIIAVCLGSVQRHSHTWVIFVAGFITFCLMLAAHMGAADLMLLMPVFNVMLLTVLILVAYAPGTTLLRAIEVQIQGVMYVPFFLSFLVLVRNGDKGGLWIVWLWLIVAASDTGAFFCGSYFGKRRLSPRISPNKTVEGALGGLVLALGVGVGFEALFIHDVSFMGSLGFAGVSAVAGQIGDLFESALKRAGGIKDSGHLLPGHGGILDRLDGVLFAAPVAYFFKEIFL